MIANPKTFQQQLCEQRKALVKRIEDESDKVSNTTDNNPDPGDRVLQETNQMRRLALIAQARWQVEQIEICLQRIKSIRMVFALNAEIESILSD